MSYYNCDTGSERGALPTLPDVSNPDWSIYYGECRSSGHQAGGGQGRGRRSRRPEVSAVQG